MTVGIFPEHVPEPPLRAARGHEGDEEAGVRLEDDEGSQRREQGGAAVRRASAAPAVPGAGPCKYRKIGRI